MEETAARIVPNILSLAGVDPSGGAGLLADSQIRIKLKT